MRSTASKAVAGGIGAQIVTVAIWALGHLPGWATIPDEPKAAIISLVSAGIGGLIVWLAPANQTVTTAVDTRPVEPPSSLTPLTPIGEPHHA